MVLSKGKTQYFKPTKFMVAPTSIAKICPISGNKPMYVTQIKIVNEYKIILISMIIKKLINWLLILGLIERNEKFRCKKNPTKNGIM